MSASKRTPTRPSKKSTPSSARARTRAPAVAKRRVPKDFLARYNAKRDFTKTAEPHGVAPTSSGNSFVIQQHDATRMHYDFRLELDGVLLSWAVPKGPSLDVTQKRLAVRTEDHPVSYRDFEGYIPDGEYGGGPVIVWDRGTWMPEGDPHFGLRKGHVGFTLFGEKLLGRFSLVRLKPKDGKESKENWLLMKHADEHAHKGRAAEITRLRPESVLSGRKLTQVEKPGTPPTPRKAKSKITRRLPSTLMPKLGDLKPQLATLVDRPPRTADWVYEIKFDGYRMLASLNKAAIVLRSRNNLDWTKTLPGVVRDLQKVKASAAILDGELCFIDERGRSSFQSLQNALPRGFGKAVHNHQLRYFVFDLLFLNGEDLRTLSLSERKARLKALLRRKPTGCVLYSDHIQADGDTALLQACAAGLEGLIAKRKDAAYREGRGSDWLKLKCHQRREFVIVGLIPAAGRRTGFRSLLLGLREGSSLRFAGRVGTGFSEDSLKDLAQRLGKLASDKSPLDDPPRIAHVAWVRPELVCEVEYTEMTADGSLRHPSFQGLREDKNATSVKRERVIRTRTLEKSGAATEAELGDETVGELTITHPERLMDSRSGTTKLEVARYHEFVSQWFMPYATSRPLSLVRCPQGDAGRCFFQKHSMPGIGAHVLKSNLFGHEILYVEDSSGVLELVQFNAMEFHAWGASLNAPDRPNWMVIDLDPDASLNYSDVVSAALEVRDALQDLGLKCWVKTTGGKGLHVQVPLTPRASWSQVKDFSHALASALEQQSPDRYVANMAKSRRKGRIFVDYLRNAQGSTAVLPYSPRSRPGATVAMPIAWKDLDKTDPREFTVRSAHQWLKKRRLDPWKDFLGTAQLLPKLKSGMSERRRISPPS